MDIQPLLLMDFYKATHSSQYPEGLTKIVSYFTPRMSRLENEDKLIMFGLQAFIKTYLTDYFNENFFSQPVAKVLNQYARVLNNTLGKNSYDINKIEALHKLGYLPLEIKAVPEGTRVPIKVPMIEISNTHDDFAWLVGWVESLISSELWHPMVSANVGYRYRQIVNEYYDLSADNTVPRCRALGDFSFRGQECLQSAIKSSSAFCLSFLNTATVATIPYLEEMYNCNCNKDEVAYGAISTEHSVMCSNYSIDGDEVTFVKRLLTETYPNQSFSMVSDSYDYWNMVDIILPSLKNEILNHDGCLSIRGDSGDPVDIICGDLDFEDLTKSCKTLEECKKYMLYQISDEVSEETPHGECGDDSPEGYFKYEGKFYKIVLDIFWNRYDKQYYYIDEKSVKSCEEMTLTPENKGTVELLWEHFGGTVNSKGYKVLNPKIKAIYGDSITPQRCEQIYKRLIDKGFACNNVSLGVGSFSMQCVEEDGLFKPFTRDTYGIAVKSTYGEIDGKGFDIFKNPKTDTGNFKKSQKGMCRVYRGKDGQINYEDKLSPMQLKALESEGTWNNLFRTVFYNSECKNEANLSQIRDRLHLETGGF